MKKIKNLYLHWIQQKTTTDLVLILSFLLKGDAVMVLECVGETQNNRGAG